MKKDPLIYLQDMLEAIALIKRYVSGMDEVAFSRADMVQHAVMRLFGIIGEAAGHVPKEICDKQPDIPWRKIKDFRNVVIHEYSGVSLGTVWNIIANELDTLEIQLESLKKQL